jgi:hypothetical protein
MKYSVRLLVIILTVFWIRQGTSVHAYPRSCDALCGETVECNTLCYPTELDFINGNEATCLDYDLCDLATCGTPCSPGNGTPGSGTGPLVTCGDDSCDAYENCDNCPNDCSASEQACGICGDNYCTASEYGGAGTGFPPQCSAYSGWCDYCDNDCGECSSGWCWPQVCGGSDERYQCKNCESTNECSYYGSAWCATGWDRDKLCHTFCWDTYECPSGYNCQENDCVEDTK